eukprot:Sdes_comp18637_c0_seq2m8834
MSDTSSWEEGSVDEKQVHTLFKDNPNWSDISPLFQDDGPNPVCPIRYSEEFEDAMNYFRRVVQTGEISERAFELVCVVCNLNSGNYTAWHYRRLLLKGLSMDILKEKEACFQIVIENPKNYQVWHHLRFL